MSTRPDWRSRDNDIFDEDADLIATTLTVPESVTALGRDMAEKDANERARMIVRAVNNFDDLLAALKRMVDVCGWDEPETYHDEQDFPRAEDPHRESVAKARAAIAKAGQP